MKKPILAITLTTGLIFSFFTTETSAHQLIYTVKYGDVLWKIAADNKVTIQDIKTWNNLNTDMLMVGQQLNLIPPHDHDQNKHTVASGETLWIIANKYNVTIDQLKTWNNLKDDWIYVGQVLVVSGNSETEKPPAAKTHTVVAGDTLWILSNKYGITVSQLKALNNLTSEQIYVGQILIVSAGELPKEEVPVPPMLQDGSFPLKAGTYMPYTNTYADIRGWNPDGTAIRAHEGVDILADKGTLIYSATNGRIVNKGWSPYGGWRITIQGNDSTALYYAHMSAYGPGNLEIGSYVTKGQLIGFVGDTGYGPEGTTGKFPTHLHFGMYNTKDSWKSMDPYPYLKYWENKQ